MKFDVEGQQRGESVDLVFDPARHWQPSMLRRPLFFPVVAAHSLATVLARKATGRVDGFVVEGPTAGGHNAPPRGHAVMNHRGEPVYGERDAVDLEVMRGLGLPFWLAGGTGSPEGLQAALVEGAAGSQVGTLFACTEESGITPALKRQMLDQVRSGTSDVITDPRASPTGFPFKVVRLPGTNSEPDEYAARERVCDLGYLRTAYRREDGRIGYRCAAEPVDAYAKKGGAIEETVGRKCLCNGLMANVGHAQARASDAERALITSGDDLLRIQEVLGTRSTLTAADVIDYLTGTAADGAASSTQASITSSAAGG